MIASDVIYEDEIFLIIDMDKDQEKEKQVKEQEKQKIIQEIGKKTEKIIKHAIETNRIVNPIDILTNKKNINPKQIDNTESILQNIMKNGAEEFEQKTGREMTYGEMRAMYG